MPQNNFSELMRRFSDGSEDAAWDIVNQYGPQIYRVVRRSLSHALRTKFDSHDFVQAVWASFFVARVRFREVDSAERLVAILAGIARHKIVDETRKRLATQRYDVRREKPLDNDAPEGRLTSNEPTPSQVAMARERWNGMLESLPPHHRDIVKLRLIGDTYDEIAENLGISKRTVTRVLGSLLRSENLR